MKIQQSLFVRSFVYLLCGIFLTTSTLARADKMSDAGAAAKAEAQKFVQQYKDSPSTFSSNTISTPSTIDDKGDVKPGTTVNINDLFQGSAASGTTPMSEYFPTDATPDIDKFKDLSGDPDALYEYSENYKNGLFVDSQKAKPTTISGDAYKLMVNEHNRTKPNLKNDPVFTKTKAVQGDIDNIAKSFSDCKTETVLNTFTKTTHIPDYKYCERITKPNLTCTLKHEYYAEPAVQGGVTTGDTTIITMGNKSGDYLKAKSKFCEVFDSSMSVTVTNPDAIVSATIQEWTTDDYAQIWAATGSDPLAHVWTGPTGWVDHMKPCKDVEDRSGTAGTDLTSFFKAATPGETVNLKFRQSVRNGGGGHFQVHITFDRNKLVTLDKWHPKECIDLANSVVDPKDIFAPSSNAKCTSMPPVTVTGGGNSPGCSNPMFGPCYTLPSKQCTKVNGVQLCTENLSNPLLEPTVSSLCQEVKVETTYNNPILAKESNCKIFEDDKTCSYVSQKCVEGAVDSKGICYIVEEKWDCGKDIAVEDASTSTKTACVGPVRCMGSDCITPDQTKSTTFAQTAAKLQSVQFMTQDMNCNTIKDGSGKVTAITGCTVFGGKAYECKVAIGGVQNCCNVPTIITASGYITALMQMSKMNSALMAVQSGSATGAVGAYQSIGKAVGQGVSEVTKPFTSYIENISGSVDSFAQPIKAFMDELKKKIKDTITDTLKKMIGKMSEQAAGEGVASAATDEAAEKAAEKAAEGVMKNMASAASTLMAIYAYYVVAMMIIQAVFKCVDEEFELAGKRKALVCKKEGEYCKTETAGGLGGCIEKRDVYCCYSSPLGRVIHDQAAPQIGIVSKKITEKNTVPNCGGIPLEKIHMIDWSKIDLSEWTAILSEHNLMPDAASMALEVLTGTGKTAENIEGNALNRISEFGSINQPSEERKDVKERTLERLDGLDIDQTRRDADDNTYVNPAGKPK